MVASVTCCHAAAYASEEEDALKAAVILAFVQHTHWPDPLPNGGPLRVCAFGRPAFITALRGGVEGKLVDGHRLVVTEIKPAGEARGCQVLYFATDKPTEIKNELQVIGNAHVLTLGESDRFLEYGGGANLFLVDGHIAFEVSLSAIERGSVEISSKLLRFGQIHDLAKGTGKEIR